MDRTEKGCRDLPFSLEMFTAGYTYSVQRSLSPPSTKRAIERGVDNRQEMQVTEKKSFTTENESGRLTGKYI